MPWSSPVGMSALWTAIYFEISMMKCCNQLLPTLTFSNSVSIPQMSLISTILSFVVNILNGHFSLNSDFIGFKFELSVT